MKTFNLPDLGEGLPDAEIVEWHVAEGDAIEADAPLVSMETAKAVVEVPSPFTGSVKKLHGQPGDVIDTGAPLVDFDVDGDGVDDGDDGGVAAAEQPAEVPREEPAPDGADEGADEAPRTDSGTVVGAMESSDEVVGATVSNVGGVKVTPAVRAIARKLKVDLATVEPTGKDGVVTRADVEQAARSPRPKPAERPAATTTAATRPATRQERPPSGEWEPVRGTRRTMARIMADAHARVVPTTIMDDADIHAWDHGQDMTVRLCRSLWAGAQVEPGLNAWYDDEQNVRMVHKGLDVGMAVDTPDGLFVAALRGIEQGDAADLRAALDRLKDNVRNRSIPPEDLKDYTIMLSNFGVFAGRYATPIINPPCVAIIAAGKLRHEVVPVLGGLEVHRTIPLSLTFDHRAVTGGEAARFLKAMIEDLGRPQ